MNTLVRSMLQHGCEPKLASPRGGVRAFQRGQAMIEYIIVLAFSVILLTKPLASSTDDPLTPVAAGSQDSALTLLTSAIQAYHQHYTYAMSIAYIPECNYSFVAGNTQQYNDYINSQVEAQSTFAAGVLSNLASQITVSGDRCPDLQNLDFNSLMPNVSLGTLSIPTSAQAVLNMIQTQLNQYIDQFKDPSTIINALNPFGSL